ncbi:MAG: hypothetical protein Q9213_001631 [Squamulea squamosa]
MNQLTIKDELRKNCISIMTKQDFSLFDAIKPPAAGSVFSSIDFADAEAEGRYVRFFEQAFEWEQMAYITYPYYWGRKSQWAQRIAFEDTDPIFNDFLRAGYARVIVPARPGFESAIDHFSKYGTIWNNGPLPSIYDPTFLSVADELAERLRMPSTAETAQGDSWEVRVPTTLVKLRAGATLPKWTKDGSGVWRPS